MFGYDKASFDERENFVMERLEEVYDSAERPLDVSHLGFRPPPVDEESLNFRRRVIDGG